MADSADEEEDLCADDADGMDLDTGQFVTTRTAKYIVIEKIGHGGYGSVYKVRRDPKGAENELAMKIEQKLVRRDRSKLTMEVHLLKLMASKPSEKNHFVSMYDKAKKDKFFMLVMTLVGDSLSDLRRRRSPPIFSLATGFGASMQCLEGIEQLHKVGFIHRDIKPGNFAIGRPPRTDVIFILDFGLARKFVTRANDVKTPRCKVSFKGTIRYASLSSHRGDELGRKDDCESWMYMMVELCNKEGLPWARMRDKKKVLQLKSEARLPEGRSRLFEPMGQPIMDKILEYIDERSYADEVDYIFICTMISQAAELMMVSLNEPFDWEKLLGSPREDCTSFAPQSPQSPSRSPLVHR